MVSESAAFDAGGFDLRRLAYFVAVVDAGGFSKAAPVLDVSQPALSRQVRLLEAEVGQRLLTRTGRGGEPTEAGRALHVHAKAIIEMARHARDELRDMHSSPRGRVTIGLPPRIAHAISADLVVRFRQRFPDATITVAEGLSMHLREWLIGGRIDLAVLYDPPYSPQLHFETLLRERLVLVASARLPALPARVKLADVGRYPLLLPGSPNALRRLLEDATQPRGVRLDVIAEVESVQTLVSLVERGVGCSVLPERAVADPRRAAAFHVAAIQSPTIRNRLALAIPNARPATRLTRACAAMLGELVRG